MSFKSQFIIKLAGVWVILAMLNPIFAALTSNEIHFINTQPLVPQLEETPYAGPSINSKSSYSKDHYKTEKILKIAERLQKRIELSIDYRNRGDIGQFSEILIDVITQNYFTEEASWAAILLGDFEVSLYNLGEALKYYIYAANIHYASGFGLAGRLRLGILLDGMGHFSKTEEVLTAIIENEDKRNPIAESAREYLKRRYLEKARWYLNSDDISNAERYYRAYQAYDATGELEATE